MAEEIPKKVGIISTYEIVDGKPKATVTHIFHGDDEKAVKDIIEAHRKTDKYFDASFRGDFNGMTLENSELLIEDK